MVRSLVSELYGADFRSDATFRRTPQAKENEMIPRLCLSGSPACSGVVPCQACAHKILTEIIPKAIMAANLNADRATAERFLLAYKDLWREMLGKLPAPEVPPTLNGAGSGEDPRIRGDEETKEGDVPSLDAPKPPISSDLVSCVGCGKPVEGYLPEDGGLPVCSVVCAGKHAAMTAAAPHQDIRISPNDEPIHVEVIATPKRRRSKKPTGEPKKEGET
jgi:hypothetical protein